MKNSAHSIENVRPFRAIIPENDFTIIADAKLCNQDYWWLESRLKALRNIFLNQQDPLICRSLLANREVILSTDACTITRALIGCVEKVPVEFTRRNPTHWNLVNDVIGLGATSQSLKTASVEMFTKKAVFISYTATIQTNIGTFYSLE